MICRKCDLKEDTQCTLSPASSDPFDLLGELLPLQKIPQLTINFRLLAKDLLFLPGSPGRLGSTRGRVARWSGRDRSGLRLLYAGNVIRVRRT